MSDYCYEKVLRVPLKKYKRSFKFESVILKDINDELYMADLYERLESEYAKYFNYGKPGFFQVAPTEGDYIDFVIARHYGDECGEWGKVRLLHESEKEDYLSIFKTIIPDIDMNDVHLVEFCWYNCSEAPDYYDLKDDEFEKELPAASSIKKF